MQLEGSSINRRTVLVGAGTVAAAATLAACSTYGDQKSDAPAEPAQPATRVDAPTDGAPPADAIATTAEVPVGSGKIVGDVVVTQPSAGEFLAFSSVCPHQGCKVDAITDGLIVCPCHGSKFKLDGTVDKGPARTGLPSVAIAIQGDSIVPA
ncbi:Rieske (2Fe-2S) protein [Antrihabitans sp. YC2-6]|uniref:Rieske (2Fe-2S) protein n=1 Tax=Antrihabitans sp. YC2-6 TaxID=2799498 RepID=UPI0018F61E68|nr:Rieske (2Fe-2S) protein [Antrihabitans sp. YC2-6]MBJ8343503.1 Rieske (2Fe-2S) protein [Antrihabitans sp. YC2-6]